MQEWISYDLAPINPGISTSPYKPMQALAYATLSELKRSKFLLTYIIHLAIAFSSSLDRLLP